MPAALGVDGDVMSASQRGQPLPQGLGGGQVPYAQYQLGDMVGGEALTAQEGVVVGDSGAPTAGSREGVGQQRIARALGQLPGGGRCGRVTLVAPGDDDAVGMTADIQGELFEHARIGPGRGGGALQPGCAVGTPAGVRRQGPVGDQRLA